MSLLAATIEYLCSLLFAPLANSPATALTIAAAILGIIFALLYGKISPQGRLKNVKRGIAAQFLRVFVFRRDLKTMLSAQAALLWGGVKYLLVTVPPIAVLLFPMLLILSEMNLWLGYRPLRAGENVLVEVQLAPSQLRAVTGLALVGQDTVKVSAPVRQGKLGLASWLVSAADKSDLKITSSQIAAQFPISASTSTEEHLQRIVPSFSNSFWSNFFIPKGSATSTIPESVEQISIDMPAREFNLFGWHTSWLTPFFVLTILFGYLAARFAKIEV